MPRTSFQKNPEVSIELDSLKALSVISGDILTGFVVLHPLRNARRFNQVQLTLYGRTKSKISRNNCQSTAIYRGRRLLFETRQTLHSENDGCQSGEHAWPFALEISKSPTPGKKHGDEYDPKPGFLSTKENMSQHNLPSTYYYYCASQGMSLTKAEAYVEYIFKVEVSSPPPILTKTTVLPLMLRAPSTETPITNFKMRSRSVPVVIKTLHLLPEHATTPPGTRKQMKSFFRPSKVPQYAFTLKADYPTVVQLNHPDPLPFRISIIPDLDGGNTTMDLENGLPHARVSGVEMYLQSTTTIQAPTTFSTTESDKTHEYRFEFGKPFGKREYTIPSSQVSKPRTSEPGVCEPRDFTTPETPDSNGSTAQDVTPLFLDLTTLLQLRLSCTHSSALGITSKFECPLTPTFRSYNINVKYEIRWIIQVECAGERESISNLFGFKWDKCVVVAPSERDVRAMEVKENAWGEERGRDWDEVGNAFGLASQGLQGLLGLIGG